MVAITDRQQQYRQQARPSRARAKPAPSLRMMQSCGIRTCRALREWVSLIPAPTGTCIHRHQPSTTWNSSVPPRLPSTAVRTGRLRRAAPPACHTEGEAEPAAAAALQPLPGPDRYPWSDGACTSSAAAQALAADGSLSDTPAVVVPPEGFPLEEVLRRVRSSVAPQGLPSALHEVEYSGAGVHLGMNVSWRLTQHWGPSGAFEEALDGKHMSFRYGYDGGAAAAAAKVEGVEAAAAAEVVGAAAPSGTSMRHASAATVVGSSSSSSSAGRGSGSSTAGVGAADDGGDVGGGGGGGVGTRVGPSCNGCCWEVDDAGVAKPLELDDREACQLATWVRSGFWLHPSAPLHLSLFPCDARGDPLPTCMPSEDAWGGDEAEAPGQQPPPRAGEPRVPPGLAGPSGQQPPQAGEPPHVLPRAEGPLGRQQQQQQQQSSYTGDSPVTAPASAPISASQGNGASSNGDDGEGPSEVWGPGGWAPHVGLAVHVGLRLWGGRLTAVVPVAIADWRPLGLMQRLCGETEVWRFGDWTQWQVPCITADICGSGAAADVGGGGAAQGQRQGVGSTMWFPREMHHQVAPGGVQRYTTTSVAATDCSSNSGTSSTGSSSSSSSGKGDAPRSIGEAAEAADELISSRYHMPPQPLLPDDTEWDDVTGCSVDAWHTSSGHLLVRPTVDDKDVGLMLLDTGASGFVLDRATADALGLAAFGEMYVSGMAGRVRCQFRRGSSFALGPLRMARPLFMEMGLAGVVRGAPGPVVGIVGYDLFRRAVVELPPILLGAAPGGAVGAARRVTIKLHRPGGERWQGEEDSVGLDGSSSAAGGRGAGVGGGVGGDSGVPEWQPLRMIVNLPYLPVAFPGPTPPRSTTPATAAAAAAATLGLSTAVQQQQQEEEEEKEGITFPPLQQAKGRPPCAGTAPSVPQPPAAAPEAVVAMAAKAAGAAGAGAAGAAADMAEEDTAGAADAGMTDAEVADTAIVGMAAETEVSEPGLRTGLFMLDSGASGVDLMFHSRAVKELGLLDDGDGGAGGGSKQRPFRMLRGVGGNGGLRVASGQLPWVEFGGGSAGGSSSTGDSAGGGSSTGELGRNEDGFAAGSTSNSSSCSPTRFHDVKCLFAGSQGLDISAYTTGIVCGDLLFRRRVLLDYARRRIAFFDADDVSGSSPQ